MNTQRLKELALRATGGKWQAFVREKTNTFSIHTPDDVRHGNIVGWMGFDSVDCSKKQKAANARFIAAANPANIIELIERVEAAEAELARRDAAAGEPVGWYDLESGVETCTFHKSNHDRWPNRYAGKLYTAPPPAVLPPKRKLPDVYLATYHEAIGWNHHHDVALALGAQPQKVVVLPAEKFCPAEHQGSLLWSETETWNKAINACQSALDVAAVKWEVKP